MHDYIKNKLLVQTIKFRINPLFLPHSKLKKARGKLIEYENRRNTSQL